MSTTTKNDVYVFGVRHLSPSGAWHLRQFLDKVRPKVVLIEGLADADEVISDITRRAPAEVPGVDLNEAAQLAMLDALAEHYAEQPYSEEPREGLRYRLDNPAFGPGDALVLYGMLRHHEPARVIEVGSGHSSCVILDVNERHFAGRMRCTFVEPSPSCCCG